MKRKPDPYIYMIIILSSGFGLITTLVGYFLSSYKSKVSVSRPPESKLVNEPIDFKAFLERNIFNIEGTIPSEGQIHQPNKCSELIKSGLPYDVTGILYGGSGENSMAILQNKNTQEVFILKYGAKLPPNGTISNIESDRVWITTTGCPEYLNLPKFKLPPSRIRRGNGSDTASDKSYSESGFERNGTNIEMTKEWVDDILTNKLTKTLGDAYVSPNFVNGRVEGFSISQIEPMSVYDKLGLKNGDVIMSINGIELNDASRAIQTLNGLRDASSINLQVKRNGQPISFSANIK